MRKRPLKKPRSMDFTARTGYEKLPPSPSALVTYFMKARILSPLREKERSFSNLMAL